MIQLGDLCFSEYQYWNRPMVMLVARASERRLISLLWMLTAGSILIRKAFVLFTALPNAKVERSARP
ncbi:MAG: hypothetical protein AB8H47_27990 [Bacteroidia bacterium]